MPTPFDALLLRIHVGEADRRGKRPVYETLVLAAREAGLAGATVLRGRMGFGANSQIQTEKILDLSSDLPLIVEIVDREEKIRAFLPLAKTVVHGGMITLEKVRAISYPRRLKPVPTAG